MENQKKDKEITLAFLFEVLKKSVLVMVIAAVVLGAAAAAYGVFIEKPKYKATASFWVNNSSNQSDYATQQQQYGAIALASSCVELVSTDLPVRRAVEECEKSGQKLPSAMICAHQHSIPRAFHSNLPHGDIRHH